MQINGRDNNDRALPYLDDKFDNESKRIKKIWLSSQLHGYRNSYIMILVSSSLSYNEKKNDNDNSNNNNKLEEEDTDANSNNNNYVNEDILPQCPNYDRYGISVKSSAELQIQAYEWRSYYDQEK